MSIQTELTRLTNAKEAIKTAIKGKGVTVPDATLLDGMAALIESIQAGGGADIHTETLITFAQDMTVKDLLDAALYKLRYQNSIIFLIATGSTAASNGSYTLNNFWIAHSGVNVILGMDQYISGKVPPNNFKNFKGIYEFSGSFKISGDGVLGSSYTGTSCSGGPGTVVQAIEIPISVEQWENWTADGTLWGEK